MKDFKMYFARKELKMDLATCLTYSCTAIKKYSKKAYSTNPLKRRRAKLNIKYRGFSILEINQIFHSELL